MRRATVFLVTWNTGKESVKLERNPASKIGQNRRRSVGLLRTDRPPLTLSGSSGLRTLS